MNVFFHPDAKAEFENAVAYYETNSQGLGVEFAEEISATTARIAGFPKAWLKLSEKSRRCLVNRLPYQIVYRMKSHGYRLLPLLIYTATRIIGEKGSNQPNLRARLILLSVS
jgi:hypothetical protein